MHLISWFVVGLIAAWLVDLVVKDGGFDVIGDIFAGVISGLSVGLHVNNENKKLVFIASLKVIGIRN